MPRLRTIKGKDLVIFLLKFGFEVKGQKGSHIKLFRVAGRSKQVLIIPNHTIQKGLSLSLFKQISVFVGKNDDDLNKFFFYE